MCEKDSEVIFLSFHQRFLYYVAVAQSRVVVTRMPYRASLPLLEHLLSAGTSRNLIVHSADLNHFLNMLVVIEEVGRYLHLYLCLTHLEATTNRNVPTCVDYFKNNLILDTY